MLIYKCLTLSKHVYVHLFQPLQQSIPALWRCKRQVLNLLMQSYHCKQFKVHVYPVCMYIYVHSNQSPPIWDLPSVVIEDGLATPPAFDWEYSTSQKSLSKKQVQLNGNIHMQMHTLRVLYIGYARGTQAGTCTHKGAWSCKQTSYQLLLDGHRAKCIPCVGGYNLKTHPDTC